MMMSKIDEKENNKNIALWDTQFAEPIFISFV